MRHRYYRSEPPGRVVPCCDVLEWGAWFEQHAETPFEQGGRRVEWTDLGEGVNVSTVFLGLDHSVFGGAPLIFETMIFGGPQDLWGQRYSTVEEARAGHAAAVRLACGEPTPEAEGYES